MFRPDLALIGADGAGKDSVANILCEDYDYRPESIARPMRAILFDIDPRYRQLVEDYGYEAAKRQTPYVRRAILELGAAAREHIGTDVWVDSLLDRLEQHEWKVVLNWVVTDVRRENEVAALADWPFQFVRIERPDHADPTLPNPPAYTIHNNGMLADLRAKVHELMFVISEERVA